MTPYYDDGTCTIYHGDCRDWIQEQPVKTFDMVFADPPYGVGLDYGGSWEDKPWGIGEAGAMAEAMQHASSGPVMVTPGIRNLYDWPAPRWTLAWHKPGSTRRSDLGGFNTWEPVLVYGQTPKRIYQDALVLPDCNNHANGSTGDHPCPKPLRLLRWLIEQATDSDALVLDPFCGSGTTLRAAKDLNRRAIGIEIEERYCEIAARRLAQEVLAL